MLPKTIQALINRRKVAGYSQEQAADMAGLSLKTYQRIENGTADIRLQNYTSLIRGLKITDLDIVLDTLDVDTTTPWDVAAAARTLPPEARAALLTIIMVLYRSHEPRL
ncbi:helix-turn-helix domain-containing protein [Motilimonas cestriensis]|uniref:Helix-turn-helix domain-containing protein n=1 Tax=Motilimonas cestriensis TaxID=2742685 RepID=A0ABS8WF35_9GAMM|nr:helix-turn-helix transcriptional regulator [Motilimonas cestriensis]MCE2597178.1 helix-turn-helix domain-containing protein [Motilimonas cestriensis]